MSAAATTTDILVVGAGHGGLAAAYYLIRSGMEVLVVERTAEVGDVWRGRYESLRLFTPRVICELPGFPIALGVDPFPTKDQIADYHHAYARWLGVPMLRGSPVLSATTERGRIVARTPAGEIEARHMVVATGLFSTPWVPPFVRGLATGATQMHASAYRRPSDLPSGTVIVVGSGNSGGDIALELARTRPVLMSEGARRRRPPPWFRSAWAWRLALLRDRWAPQGLPGPWTWPLKPLMPFVPDVSELVRTGQITRIPRAVGATEDELLLEDGSRLRADVVIWATGYRSDLSWIERPEDPRVHVLSARFLFGLPHRAAAIARRIQAVTRGASGP